MERSLLCFDLLEAEGFRLGVESAEWRALPLLVPLCSVLLASIDILGQLLQDLRLELTLRLT